jgi:predicted CoA-binding protein
VAVAGIRTLERMQQAGYRIIPVNPALSEVLGERCYPDVAAVPEPIDIVDIFRRPEFVPEIVDAADWLRGELGVSKPLWGEACLAMGREEAAIAVAIVSAKPADHFRSSPGGYFYGMVAKAKAGELNLARTIWGLRARDRKAGEGRSPRRPT